MTDIRATLAAALKPEQLAAALDPAAEILAIACAGSGKSRTLAYRIVRLLAEGSPPSSIVAFTFTEKAADSIKRRVSGALAKAGIEPAVMGAMYIGTIHSYCQHVLGEIDPIHRQFDVLDENRLKLYLLSRYPKLKLLSLRGRTVSPGRPAGSQFETIRQVSEAWKIANDEMLDLDELERQDSELGLVLKQMRDDLHQDQYIDFSLMIRKVAEALERREPGALRAVAGLRHLMVDEYQDVNPSQEKLIRQLRAHCETLFVVGDDDQSIYAWRGADVSNILGFQERYPSARRHTLSINFRSTAPIVRASAAFATTLGPRRFSKQPTAHADHTPQDFRTPWFDDRAAEAAWVADRIASLIGTAYTESDGKVRGLTPADFAILMQSTKTDDQSETPRHTPFTRALMERGIPYSLAAGGGPFERPQVAALRDAFRLLHDGTPTREQAKEVFNASILPAYPKADFDQMTRVLFEWARLIHAPMGIGAGRRRVHPQQLVYDLLEAFHITGAQPPIDAMRDIGLFSRMIQDVEAVYPSVDSASRFRDIVHFLTNIAESGYDVSTDDVILRPDTVTVSTIHKVKGLEFPGVFVVDVMRGRFPKNKRKYGGWLPAIMLTTAIDRGAYQSTHEEQIRLFYTALTRAERYLYVTGSTNQPGGRKLYTASPYTQQLTDPAISADAVTLPPGLAPAPSVRRVDENNLPTSFSQIRYYLRCPMDYRYRQSFGFSPPIPDMFGFGQTVHTSIGKVHAEFPSRPPTAAETKGVVEGAFHLKHVPKSKSGQPGPYERAQTKAVEIVQTYARDFETDFIRRRQVEARFEIPAKGSVISGSIDLLLKEDPAGQLVDAQIIDFKAMQGSDPSIDADQVEWPDLALQVQLYAHAAREVLGEDAQTGHVHLLKSNNRIEIPIDKAAVEGALGNVEWAVGRIIAGDFPARPHPEKCKACDMQVLCPKRAEEFAADAGSPPVIHMPHGQTLPAAFSKFDPSMGH